MCYVCDEAEVSAILAFHSHPAPHLQERELDFISLLLKCFGYDRDENVEYPDCKDHAHDPYHDHIHQLCELLAQVINIIKLVLFRIRESGVVVRNDFSRIPNQKEVK